MSEPRQTTRPDDPFAGPADGWDTPPPPPPPRPGSLDLSALFVLVDALRGALPSGVQAQFTSLLREVLLTLRSLIDWYLERLDQGPSSTRVEDIEID